jgi:hypothetical protein
MLDPAQFIELKASGNLPSPKGSALRVLELCQRDDVTLPEIIHVMQIDPATVGRILKLANSAAFGRARGRRSDARRPDVDRHPVRAPGGAGVFAGVGQPPWTVPRI